MQSPGNMDNVYICVCNKQLSEYKDGEFCPATMSCIRTIPFSDVTEVGGGGT